MSDTFDHEGDAWDSLNDDQYHEYRSRQSYRPLRPVTCKRCGAENLKWRTEGDRWVLIENERVQPGNYKPEHVCPPAENLLEGFD